MALHSPRPARGRQPRSQGNRSVARDRPRQSADAPASFAAGRASPLSGVSVPAVRDSFDQRRRTGRAVRARRLRRLLVPPRLPPGANAVGHARSPSLHDPLQSDGGGPPRLDRTAVGSGVVLPAARRRRLPPARDHGHDRAQPALSVLPAYRARPAPRRARMGAQHADAPPGASCRKRGLPRQELRRRLHRLGPPVRHLRRRAERREAALRAADPAALAESHHGELFEWRRLLRDVHEARGSKRRLRILFGRP
jgi:hypothetical protein